MRMRLPPLTALLVFVYVFAEIAAFIYVGGKIGIMATLIIVMLSAVLGLMSLRGRWVQFLREIRGIMHNGAMPDTIPAKLLLSSCGAVLMILPGLISSAIGLIMLMPPAQDRLIKFIAKKGRIETEVVYDEGRDRQNGAPEKVRITNLSAEDYHAQDPENSPWRRP